MTDDTSLKLLPTDSVTIVPAHERGHTAERQKKRMEQKERERLAKARTEISFVSKGPDGGMPSRGPTPTPAGGVPMSAMAAQAAQAAAALAAKLQTAGKPSGTSSAPPSRPGSAGPPPPAPATSAAGVTGSGRRSKWDMPKPGEAGRP